MTNIHPKSKIYTIGVMDSPDESIKNQAVSMLISKAMVKEDYDQVQSLLQLLPEPSSVDKKQLSVNLSIAQGHLEDAAKTEEERLITAAIISRQSF